MFLVFNAITGAWKWNIIRYCTNELPWASTFVVTPPVIPQTKQDNK